MVWFYFSVLVVTTFNEKVPDRGGSTRRVPSCCLFSVAVASRLVLKETSQKKKVFLITFFMLLMQYLEICFQLVTLVKENIFCVLIVN